jgi:hypothetical protein
MTKMAKDGCLHGGWVSRGQGRSQEGTLSTQLGGPGTWVNAIFKGAWVLRGPEKRKGREKEREIETFSDTSICPNALNQQSPGSHKSPGPQRFLGPQRSSGPQRSLASQEYSGP